MLHHWGALNHQSSFIKGCPALTPPTQQQAMSAGTKRGGDGHQDESATKLLKDAQESSGVGIAPLYLADLKHLFQTSHPLPHPISLFCTVLCQATKSIFAGEHRPDHCKYYSTSTIHILVIAYVCIVTCTHHIASLSSLFACLPQPDSYQCAASTTIVSLGPHLSMTVSSEGSDPAHMHSLATLSCICTYTCIHMCAFRLKTCKGTSIA
eukprot:10497289-Karenia_brevis.AAC.1